MSRNQTSNDSNQENATFSSAELSPLPSVSTKFVNGTMLSNHNCTTTPSPLSERAIESVNQIYTSPPNTTSTYSPASSTSNSASNPSTSFNLSAQQQSVNSVIYSPTTNLPNFVLDGDAPHLAIMSPKRKLRDKVDWLTKIRKQKLMSSCRGSTITDKITEERMDEITTPLTNGHCTVGIAGTAAAAASPRLQSLRGSEGPSSPRASHSTVPRRRTSRSGSHSNELLSSPSSSHHHIHNHHPKTPTSSRRNSETTILRFFSVQQQQQHQQQRSGLAVEMAQTLTETSAAIAPAATTTTCTE